MKRTIRLVLAGILASLGGAAQYLYVTSSNTHEVLRYNGSTGASLGAFVTAGSGGLRNPLGLTFGPDENLYVVGSGQVWQYNGNDGAFVRGLFTDLLMGGTVDITTGPDGTLYLALSSDAVGYGDVLKGANVRNSFTGFASMELPGGLTFGPDGNLYVSTALTNEVLKYNGRTGDFLGVFVASSGPVDPYHGPQGLSSLTFGPDGNLYVANTNTNEVLRYNGSTGASLGAFVTSGSGGLNRPHGLTFGPDRNLYVTSYGTNEVLKYNGSTGASLGSFVTAGSGGLNGPMSLTFFCTARQQRNGCMAASPPPTPPATPGCSERDRRAGLCSN